MATERCGRDVWESRVKDFQSSGMTQKEWCNANGIGVRALCYWISKLKNECSSSDAPEWLKIETKANDHIAAVSVSSAQCNAVANPLEFRIQLSRLSVFVPFQAEDGSILKLIRMLEGL